MKSIWVPFWFVLTGILDHHAPAAGVIAAMLGTMHLSFLIQRVNR